MRDLTHVLIEDMTDYEYAWLRRTQGLDHTPPVRRIVAVWSAVYVVSRWRVWPFLAQLGVVALWTVAAAEWLATVWLALGLYQ